MGVSFPLLRLHAEELKIDWKQIPTQIFLEISINFQNYPLCKKCPNSELFWSAFSRIRTEYGEIRIISPYSVRMRENAVLNNSEYRHFFRSDYSQNISMTFLVRTLSNIYNELLCMNNWQFLDVNYFRKRNSIKDVWLGSKYFSDFWKPKRNQY